jgi:hypothetical protein
MRFVLLVSLVVTGCAKDPCEGVSGACIAVRVEGSPADLDQLRITLDKPVPRSVSTPTPASQFTLPVKVAVAPPAGFTGSATLIVEGVRTGMVVGRAAPTAVEVSGGRTEVTVTLSPASGGLDLSEPAPDMTMPGLTIVPSILMFADTPRGSRAAQDQMFTVTNTSNTTISIANVMDSGEMTSFLESQNGTTCRMGQTSWMPGESCRIVVGFEPKKSGDLQKTSTISLSNGQQIVLTYKGKGTPVWSREMVTGSGVNLRAVSGSGPDNIYAVGDAMALIEPAIYRWDGTMWNAHNKMGLPTGAAVAPLWSVAVPDAQRVWVGNMGSGIFTNTGGGGAWNPEPGGVNGTVKGLWFETPSDGFAITDTASQPFYRRTSGTWGQIMEPGPTMALCAKNASRVYTFVGGGQLYYWDGAANTVQPTLTPAAIGTISACWYDPVTNQIFYTTHDPAGTMTAYIYRIDIDATTGRLQAGAVNAMVSSSSSSRPLAIHGRSLPGGPREIYAVGAFGGRLLRSTDGSGWTYVNVPTTGALGGVYVAPNGDVAAVGFGEIAHLR